MKKKDEDAFLKSIVGTKPIIKRNILKKGVPITNITNIKKNYTDLKIEVKQKKSVHDKDKKSFFVKKKKQKNKKIKKGRISIDRKVDFHGLSVLDAEDLFLKTIENCYNKNLRCILFVTGKGIMKKYDDKNKGIKLYYGKIREGFLFWVTKQQIQKYILSVEQASLEYGADGAFFVYLRKHL